MFANSASLRLLALVAGASFLNTVSAASPCPGITSYAIVVDVASSTGCECINTNPGNGEPVTEDANAACSYTQEADNTCTPTCPTGSRRRRSEPEIYLNADRSIINCPQGQISCPITSSPGSNHECVDIQSDLDNCGGCVALGQGQICGKQAGIRTASCINGVCQTHSCKMGYTFDAVSGQCNRID